MKKIYEDIIGVLKCSRREYKKKKRVEREIKEAVVLKIVETTKKIEDAVYSVSPETYESLPIPKIWGINEVSIINKYFPELKMYKFYDAETNIKADWVIQNNKVIWDKYFMQQFNITIVCDYGVIKTENGNLLLRKEVFENDVVEADIGYSLGGVQCDHWGHFSLQYLPKLYEIPKILEYLKGKKLTVFVPSYGDKQIERVVYEYLKQFKQIEIVKVRMRTRIKCKELFYMNKASYIMEHSHYYTRATWNLSTYSAEALKKNFLKDIEKYDEDRRMKIYLDRPFGMHRRMKNGEQIRKYFEEEGFTVIEDGGRMSLEEKIKLYRNASFLAGPEGTAFMNVIFCRPNTKILKFASYVTAENEFMSGFYDKHWGLETVLVCAYDDNTGEPHEDYTIPLELVKEAYNEIKM